jgi:hypothetical protein
MVDYLVCALDDALLRQFQCVLDGDGLFDADVDGLARDPAVREF